jgi:hypothetical protein
MGGVVVRNAFLMEILSVRMSMSSCRGVICEDEMDEIVVRGNLVYCLIGWTME